MSNLELGIGITAIGLTIVASVIVAFNQMDKEPNRSNSDDFRTPSEIEHKLEWAESRGRGGKRKTKKK